MKKTTTKQKQKNRARAREQRGRRQLLRPLYDAYIGSQHWADVKRQKAAIEPMQCASCASIEKIHCHHMCYREPLESVLLTDLMWLCEKCHKAYHEKMGCHLSVDLPLHKMVGMTLCIIRGEPLLSTKQTWTPKRKVGALSPALNDGRPVVYRKTIIK